VTVLSYIKLQFPSATVKLSAEILQCHKQHIATVDSKFNAKSPSASKDDYIFVLFYFYWKLSTTALIEFVTS